MRWSSFIKIAFRNILLHRGFSLVSLIGLSFGIAIALLVLDYVDYETSYDTHYPESEHIYRLVSHGMIGDDTIQSALTPQPLAQVASGFNGVKAASRLVPGTRKLVKSNYARFNEPYFFYADKSFFHVFEIPFLIGNSTEVFNDTNSVVLSRSASQRFFGTRNPLGEELTLDNGLVLKVTGVYYDLPENTHLRADFIANWQIIESRMEESLKGEYPQWINNWFALNTYTYLRLSEDVSIDSLENYINTESRKLSRIYFNEFAVGMDVDYEKMTVSAKIQPISEIHLSTHLDHEIQKGASSAYVSVFAGIAIFILVITAINFMNLTTARAARRFKEIAVRKTFGAGRRHLVLQFFIESVLFCFLALGLALVFMEIFFVRFTELFDISMGNSSFINQISFGWVLLITLLIGVIAGSYPSFFFSGLRAEKVFKGQVRTQRWGIITRGILVAFQICIAVALMSVSMAMHNQLNFLKSAPVGYNPEDLIVIEREYALGAQSDSVKQILLSKDEIESVSSVHFVPGDETSIMSYKNVSDTAQVVLMATNMVDAHFFKTIGARLAKGRWFEVQDYADSSLVVINESAARMLGFNQLENCKLELIGSGLATEQLVLNVIGVIKDIHYESLKNQVRPMVFMQHFQGARSEHLLVKFKEGSMETGIPKVEDVWASVLPEEPFVYFIQTDRLDELYREEYRFARIGFILAFIALVFAILGLIGMVSFVVQSKSRNMKISRMLSASSPLILVGTFRGVSGYIFAGILSSLLISPLVIDYWLSGFYYSFTPSGNCLIIPLVFMSVVSFLTVYLVGIRVFKSVVKKSES